MSWLSSALGDVGGAVKGAISNPLVDAGLAFALPGVGSLAGGLLGGIPGASSIEGLLGKAGGLLTGNGGLNALGLAQGINAAGTQNKANNYANQALQTQQNAYNSEAPLRSQGIQGMLNPHIQDLSGLNATRNSLQAPPQNIGQSTPTLGATSLSAIQGKLNTTPNLGGFPFGGVSTQPIQTQTPTANLSSLQGILQQSPFARTA